MFYSLISLSFISYKQLFTGHVMFTKPVILCVSYIILNNPCSIEGD